MAAVKKTARRCFNKVTPISRARVFNLALASHNVDDNSTMCDDAGPLLFCLPPEIIVRSVLVHLEFSDVARFALTSCYASSCARVALVDLRDALVAADHLVDLMDRYMAMVYACGSRIPFRCSTCAPGVGGIAAVFLTTTTSDDAAGSDNQQHTAAADSGHGVKQTRRKSLGADETTLPRDIFFYDALLWRIGTAGVWRIDLIRHGKLNAITSPLGVLSKLTTTVVGGNNEHQFDAETTLEQHQRLYPWCRSLEPTHSIAHQIEAAVQMFQHQATCDAAAIKPSHSFCAVRMRNRTQWEAHRRFLLLRIGDRRSSTLHNYGDCIAIASETFMPFTSAFIDDVFERRASGIGQLSLLNLVEYVLALNNRRLSWSRMHTVMHADATAASSLAQTSALYFKRIIVECLLASSTEFGDLVAQNLAGMCAHTLNDIERVCEVIGLGGDALRWIDDAMRIGYALSTLLEDDNQRRLINALVPALGSGNNNVNQVMRTLTYRGVGDVAAEARTMLSADKG